MKERLSNIELLRVISMLLIILFHASHHTNFYFEYRCLNYYIIKVINHFGELGVNLFFLISGYFLVNKKIKLKRIILIWFELLFYNVICLIACVLFNINYELNSIQNIVRFFTPFYHVFWWFASAYILIYLLTPILNMILKKTSKKRLCDYLIVMLIIYCIIPTVLGIFENTSENFLFYNRFFWGIIMYLIGGYIRLYGLKAIDTIKKSINISLISFLCILITIYTISKHPHFFEKIGLLNPNYLWPPNTICEFLLAIGIFGIFIKLNIKQIKIINKLATTTLGVYLLHDHQGLLIWKNIIHLEIYQYNIKMIFYLIGYSLIIMLIGSCIELVRQSIEKHTIERLLESKTCKKLKKKLLLYKKQFIKKYI